MMSEFEVNLHQFTWEIHMANKQDLFTLLYITTVPSDINIVQYRKAYYKSSTQKHIWYISHILYSTFPSPLFQCDQASLCWLLTSAIFIRFLFFYIALLQYNFQHYIGLPTENKADLWRQICLCYKTSWGRLQQELPLFWSFCKLFKDLMHLKNANYESFCNTPKL